MTAKDAIESGRQRLLMEKGDHIKATLQDVPHSDTARSIHLLIDLAGQNKGMRICWSWCLGAQTRATLTRDSMHACMSMCESQISRHLTNVFFAGVLLQLERGAEHLADHQQKAIWQSRAAWLRSE